MTINISFLDTTVRVAVEINGAIESAITELPKREWVGLTDDEIESALPGYRAIDALDIYHAIEKALQEKNT